MRAVEVVAINNEKMVVLAENVVMVGPLMDRGVAMLGRSVLYIEGLPPLPIKETRRDVSARLGWRVINCVDMGDEGSAGSGGADGSADGGSGSGLVVSA